MGSLPVICPILIGPESVPDYEKSNCRKRIKKLKNPAILPKTDRKTMRKAIQESVLKILAPPIELSFPMDFYLIFFQSIFLWPLLRDLISHLLNC